MKLYEITNDDADDIDLEVTNLFRPQATTPNFSVNYDGTVDVAGHVYLDGSLDLETTKVKFDVVKGNFSCKGCELTHIDFAPRKCMGFDVSNNQLDTFTNLPDCTWISVSHNALTEFPILLNKYPLSGIEASNNRITSIVGIADKIVRMSSTTRSFLELSFDDIKSGGLGLVLIPGLMRLANVDSDDSPDPLPGPFMIIQKYLGRPDDIFECQAELIENGFEEFAIL